MDKYILAKLSQQQRCLYNRYVVNKSYTLQISDLWAIYLSPPVPLSQKKNQSGSRLAVQDFTTIQVDLIQMDDYPAHSCAISPTAFLLITVSCRWLPHVC